MKILTLFFILRCVGQIDGGKYIISDYYMDPSQSDAFGGACGETIQDDSLFMNSHVNPFGIVNYGNNKDCWLVLDAGITTGARYRLSVVSFAVEDTNADGHCNDFMALYNWNAVNDSALFGKFCGTETPNISSTSFGRYTTIAFHTDGRQRFKGFRLMATRFEPGPCASHEFMCPLEALCIDNRIHCDGTDHCTVGEDELDCTALEKFAGVFLRLGLGGIIATGVAVVGGLVILATLGCCFKCCKRDRKVAAVEIVLGKTSIPQAETSNQVPIN